MNDESLASRRGEMDRVSFFCDALELCADPRTYFTYSSSSLLTPVAALGEVIEALEAYEAEPTLALKAVVPALKRASTAIASSLAPSVRDEAAVGAYMELAQSATSRELNHGALSAHMRSSSVTLSEAASRAMQAYSEGDRYRMELSLKVSELFQAPGNFNAGSQRRLQGIARELVAAVGNEGRTPELFAQQVRQRVLARSTAADAAVSFMELMREQTSSFQVAIVVDGTVRTLGLDQSVFRRLNPSDPVAWTSSKPGTKHHAADMDLARFCLQHWGLTHSADPTYRHHLLSQVLITKVEAWDAEQARHAALDAAEELVDRINAEHRTSHFGVKRKAMVWEEGTKTAEEVFPKDKIVVASRQMNISKAPSVNRSLRFASRAAGERAGSMQVFFAWIALEYLGRGASETPQNLVARTVPYAVSLVELRHLLMFAWVQATATHGAASLPLEVLEAIKRSNKKSTRKSNPNEFDSRKFMALVMSDGSHPEHLARVSRLTLEEAQSAMRAWVGFQRTLSIHSAYQIRYVRDILRDNTRLQMHVDAVRVEADGVLQRMRFVRNQTAHNAGAGSTEHLALSESALKVLDAVFEVLPLWQRDPYQALEAIESRWRETRSRVSSRGDNRHMPPFDPHVILKP